MPLGTSGFKDPTQGHFLPYRQLPCPAPKGRGDRCVLLSPSPRKLGPAHSALHSSYFLYLCVFPYSFDLSTRTNYVKFH